MNRPYYLECLKRKKHNGMIKIISGIRRCGKSYLLFNLFYDSLLKDGVKADHIITLALEDRKNKKYRDPDELLAYVEGKISDGEMYYILLDEVQMVTEFEDVLNSFLHIKNADTYVTGSNAKFLSKDIITEFRGRGDQIHLYPLSFKEYVDGTGQEVIEAWQTYTLYGGLPKITEMTDRADKENYLKNIITETYIKDILERNNVKNIEEIGELLSFTASSIGGLTNPKKLSDTFKSVGGKDIHQDTINNYLQMFEDSFLISKAVRYDVKGKKYFNTPFKYYFTDMGLRNAELNFRQYEETHITENIIYNELVARGYNVDVGTVFSNEMTADKKRTRKQLEIDFVCNRGSQRIYVQSALIVADREKELRETKPFGEIRDSFKKALIVKDVPTHYNENGILIINLFDFLLNENSLNQ